MKDRYTLSMKITVGLSMIYLGWISLPVFTIEISIELLNQQSLAIELFKVKENLYNNEQYVFFQVLIHNVGHNQICLQMMSKL